MARKQNRGGLDTPYPPVEVSRPDLYYAGILLDNVGGSCSEMSTVARYIYNHTVLCEDKELSRTFLEIGITEMRHLEIFTRLAFLLGEDPRLWTWANGGRTYWSPAFIRYDFEVYDMLTIAIQEEEKAIQKYSYQMEQVQDEKIVRQLWRIIQDEEYHVELLSRHAAKI